MVEAVFMRLVLPVILTLMLGAPAFAQRGGHGGGGFGRGGGFSGGHGGFGGGGFRGGGMMGGGGVIRGGGFSSGFRGPVHGGFGGGTFHGPFRGGNFGFRNGFHNGFGRFGFRFRGPRFVGFYGYPFYGFGYGYGYGYDPFWSDSSDYYAPAVSYSMPYEPYYGGYGSEPVIINQEPAPVVINEPPPAAAAPYQAAPMPPPSNEPISYLIAFNDHNIKLALAYWTENHNLRYVTMEHEIKTAPLSSVDRDLSMQLNRERRIPFRLPATGG